MIGAATAGSFLFLNCQVLPMNTFRHSAKFGILLLVLGAVLVVVRFQSRSPDVADARRALRDGRFDEAVQLAERITAVSGSSQIESALQIAMTAHLELGNVKDAVHCLQRMPRRDVSMLPALKRAALKAFDQSKLSAAELLLREILQLSPEDVPAHRQLAAILNATGRRWEAAAHGRRCLAASQFTLGELLLWSNPEEPYEDVSILPTAVKKQPNDSCVRLSQILVPLLKGDSNISLSSLRDLLQDYDAGLEAWSILGNAYLDKGELESLPNWNQSLSPMADSHSEIWFVRGRWSQLTGQTRAATRCYWESCVRNPFSRRANFQLGQQLAALGENEKAQPWLKRAEQLAELQQAIRPVYFDGATADELLKIVDQLQNLERFEEAAAWLYAASRLFPDNRLIAEHFPDVDQARKRDRNSQEIAGSVNVGSADFSDYPLPNWTITDFSTAVTSRNEQLSVRFSDEARRSGIGFQYFNSDDPKTRGKRIFETTGGGVAVADYDGNGWPDLYFTQGCRWPVSDDQSEYRDHCYLNDGRGGFRDVAEVSGLLEYRYSQGVSAGDLDNDGFSDLYVANIGQNQIFRNNGDGTFSRDDDSVLLDDSWTTSCVIADLDNDGMPDLFDANYLSDRSTFERGCGTDDPDECLPKAFKAAQSRVYLNRGDESWVDGTELLGLQGIVGKALGVVVFRKEPRDAPALFVANDGEANFWWRPTSSQRSQLCYEEAGVYSGLAFDGNGRAQGSMGVAAGDADGDGLLDLFVTNFYRESNTLYRQQQGDLFLDMTHQSNLREPSILKLGFGTQFMDINVDGSPDLVLTNGHVVDRQHKGEEYHMSPQCFLNQGDGKFVEVFPSDNEDFFAGEYLGRGLAKLDWNRDGLEDFAVSHLDSPASLVTNKWLGGNHHILITLTGVLSSRDAIGARVILTAAGKTQTQHMTAGDGYQASNQRHMIFGLGESAQAESISVEWPSGETQLFHNVEAGAELRLVEGRAAPVNLNVR